MDERQLEAEARRFLTEKVGIQLGVRNQEWKCLSCLLTEVYDLFCRAGPEGDINFKREVDQDKFERVSPQQDQGAAAASHE